MASPKKAPLIDWEKLDQLLVVDETVGPEWFSTKEFAERYKITTNKADGRLRRLVASGKIEVTKVKNNNKNYYKIK